MVALKTIAYVMEVPPDERDFKRHGMEFFTNNGINLLVADATSFVRPSFVENRVLPESFPRTELRKYAHLSELEQMSAFISKADLIIMQAGDNGTWQTTLLYRAMCKAQKPYLVMSSNAYPSVAWDSKTSLIERIVKKWQDWKDGKIKPLNSLIHRIPRAWLGIRPADFAVYGGKISAYWTKVYPKSINTRAIFAHSMDYDVFKAAVPKMLESEPIAVFIDENTCFKRDSAYWGIKEPEVEVYYPKLCRVFDRIEQEFGLRVVIAANPRANYKGQEQLLGNREIFYQATAAQVARASLVIAQRSTSIGYAVLTNKPIFLITLKEIYEHWSNRSPYDGFAQALGKKIEFFDDPEKINISKAMEINPELYRKYRENYIKIASSPDLPFWEIVFNEVTKEIG